MIFFFFFTIWISSNFEPFYKFFLTTIEMFRRAYNTRSLYFLARWRRNSRHRHTRDVQSYRLRSTPDVGGRGGGTGVRSYLHYDYIVVRFHDAVLYSRITIQIIIIIIKTIRSRRRDDDARRAENNNIILWRPKRC